MDIKKTKDSNKAAPPVSTTTMHKVVIGGYIIAGCVCATVYILARYELLSFGFLSAVTLSKLGIAGVCIALLMIGSRLTERVIVRKAHNKGSGYNVIKVIRFFSVVLSILILVSFLKSNWYAAAVSLGLISLLLGFALQTPIASLIGWFYIVIRTPFRIGDRIQVQSFTGDVVEINYLDTTLWEFGGDYLTNDLPSGRLIRFPNSLVFSAEVYNYSWNKFPFIWNEIAFHLAYESDFDYVESVIRKVAAEVLDNKIHESVKALKSVVKETAVDELHIKEYPFVQFRTNPNTWVEVLLIYLTEPKQSGLVKSRLTKEVITQLLQQPDKVMFPKSSAR